VLKHGKTLRAFIKNYSIFTRFLQHLYDLPPNLCHTPQRQSREYPGTRAGDGSRVRRYRLERATGKRQENKEEHRMAQTAQHDHIGEAYWRDFYNNCLVIGLVCQQ